MSSESDRRAPPDPAPMSDTPAESGSSSSLQQVLYRNRDLLARLVVISVVFASTGIATGLWVTGNLQLHAFGYVGVWLFSFIGAVSVLVPVPGTAAACVAAAPAIGLFPLFIGVVSGSAEVLGEMSGYLAGVGGRDILHKNRFYPRARRLMLRRGGVLLFFAAIVPNPLFDVAGMAAGSAGYPVRKFIPIVFVAKSIKSTWVAYACYAGIGWIESLFR
jgi:membrane protein DedA with SNARE-associated domain